MRFLIIFGVAIGPWIGLTGTGWTIEYADLPSHLQSCTSCHDASGTSQSKFFPNLAGQKKAYLAAQLQAFRDKSRNDPDAIFYMQAMAGGLSDDDIQMAADYFSSQPARPADPENPSVIEKGRIIFQNGIPAKQVPACRACHGLDAHGQKSFPRLASQHATYLMKQLSWFRSGERASPTMKQVSQSLTLDEIEAVANFLQSLL